jgi:hypothetical protein
VYPEFAGPLMALPGRLSEKLASVADSELYARRIA